MMLPAAAYSGLRNHFGYEDQASPQQAYGVCGGEEESTRIAHYIGWATNLLSVILQPC
jgi:hypothetical protein